MKRDFAYTPLEWNSDKISRFWDFASQFEPYKNDYFSKQVGNGVFNFLKRIAPLNGNILDYGCGPGYLVDELITNHIECEAIDFSSNSIKLVNQKYKNNPYWKGAKLVDNEKLPYPDNKFDLIICLETIEHVLDDQMPSLLSELSRILKPNTGQLFITTPNNENVLQNSVFCPQCNNYFHKYQHLRSFSKQKLTNLMTEFRFETDLCEGTDFHIFQRKNYKNPIDWNIRYLYQIGKNGSTSILDKIHFPNAPKGGFFLSQNIGDGPHLFWIGHKLN